MKQVRSILGAGVLLVIFGLAIWGAVDLARDLWRTLVGLNTTLAASLLTAATTVVVATLTIVVGRYQERKKEIEAHFRPTKVELYDELLAEFFKVFYAKDAATDASKLVDFIREWQRKMILWGGAKALNAFIAWKEHVTGEPDANSIFLLEEFIKALRHDIGLSNRHLGKGMLAKLILKNPNIFLQMAANNPNVTFTEVADKEKELGLDG